MTMEPKTCLTVYHDGSCPLCQREIALVSKLVAGQNVTFTDVSTLADTEIAAGFSAQDAMGRFHVRRADGTLLAGANAFIEMWSLAPCLAFLKPLQRSPRTLWLLDLLYNSFLVVRPWVSSAGGRYDRWAQNRWSRENSHRKSGS